MDPATVSCAIVTTAVISVPVLQLMLLSVFSADKCAMSNVGWGTVLAVGVGSEMEYSVL